MIRLLLLTLLSFLPALGLLPSPSHATGNFMFSGSAGLPTQSEDDEEVEEDYSLIERNGKPVPRIAPHMTARPADDETESAPPCRNCSVQRRLAVPARLPIPSRVQVMSTPSNMRTPVWPTFAHNFAICAPGCQPAQMGIYRAQDGSMSCHHSSRAIDVGAMICGGRVYRAINGGRFSRMVACMRPRMKTIYQQARKRHLGATQAHYDHAHFSITCYGGTFW